ncbi:hypothetical protein GGQ77_002489 [Geobacillus thermodenitrificans]|nr:hypothetical protein [Geobacillus thermodenitrificans]
MTAKKWAYAIIQVSQHQKHVIKTPSVSNG